MRPIPLPDSWKGPRITLGIPEKDVHACEYAVVPSDLYPGKSCVYVQVVFDNKDRKLIAEGGVIWLAMDGGELPWSLIVTPGNSEVPWI